MTHWILRVQAAIFAACFAFAATAETRVALVVGNSAYDNATPLANPGNDSRAIAEKLRGLGFDVAHETDLTGQGFRIALGQFTEQALRADLALFYYAGHGIEMSGKNYLIPTDASMTSEATAKFETISLDDVLSAVRQASGLGIVMLDACRDNPFGDTMMRNNGTRAISRGLAPVSVEGESGIVVSFAAQEGRTADDGEGMHSPYTQAVLEVIDEPGLEVGRVFRKVRAQVRTATNGRQVPIERMQLPDRAIYLAPEVVVEPDPEPDPAPAPDPVAVQPEPLTEDPYVVFLDAVTSGESKQLADFLRRYPNHAKAADARALLESYEDDAFWAKTKEQNTVTAYRRYMIAFSTGQYVDQAAQRIAALQKPSIVVPDPEPEPEPEPAPVVQPDPEPEPDPEPPVVAGFSPSFDCNKASTNVEHAICGSETLAKLDHTLLAAYKRARDAGRVSPADQRGWVVLREAICANQGNRLNDCVQTLMDVRIAALDSGRFSGRIKPSYNCGKATTPIELAICRDDTLSQQDQFLLSAYKSARNRGTVTPSRQRSWLKQRDSRCGHTGFDIAKCIASMTSDRVNELLR